VTNVSGPDTAVVVDSASVRTFPSRPLANCERFCFRRSHALIQVTVKVNDNLEDNRFLGSCLGCVAMICPAGIPRQVDWDIST
jgi:hypothetical protein